MRKRLMAILLTAAMLLTLMPAALADDMEAAAVEAAETETVFPDASEPEADEALETYTDEAMDAEAGTDPAIAASGTCGDNLTWTLDDAGLLTISGSGAMKNYSVSAYPWVSYRSDITAIEIEYGVTSIGEYAFGEFYGSVNSVSISNSVASIGSGAFEGCSALTGVEIPDSVTAIGQFAFSYSGLTSIALPAQLTEIAPSTFLGCSSLTSVTIPDCVTSIGYCAFDSCIALTEFTIPSGVTTIGEAVFSSCSSLTSVTIPDSVTTITTRAFELCSSLKDIYYPGTAAQWAAIRIGTRNEYLSDAEIHYGKGAKDEAAAIVASGTCGDNLTWTLDDAGLLTISGSGAMEDYTNWKNVPWHNDYEDIVALKLDPAVTGIGAYAFFGCRNLSDLTLASNIISIGENAFNSCHSLTSVTVPGSITTISSCAFYHCTHLESVTIEDGVTRICENAFGSLDSLKCVTVPRSVTTIDAHAFFASNYITTVYYGGTEAAWNAIFSGSLSNATIHCRPALEITTQPQSVTALAGTRPTMTVAATGDGLSYQWQILTGPTAVWKNTGTSGSTTDTIRIIAAAIRNGFQYRCIVTDQYGTSVTSDAATLTVRTPLAITTQPQNTTAAPGTNAKMTVAATGDGLTYQWQLQNRYTGIWNNTGMSGNKTKTLTVAAAASRNGYQYRCVITDQYGASVTSDAATLTVK